MSVLRFGAFVLNPLTGELRKGAALLNIPPQPFKVLVLLATHPGELVSREAIQREIWGKETFVDFDQGLNFAINKIRTTLGDSAATPRYIETLARRGYRFIASVETMSPEPASFGLQLDNREQDSDNVSLRPAVEQGAALEETSKPEAPSTPGRYGLGRTAAVLCATGALLVAMNARPIRDRFGTHPVSKQIRSLAVMPLQNLSGDKEQAYFADGLTDELTTNLAGVRSLHVISRTTMMQYRDTHMPLRQIGRELHVDAVVQGSVIRSGRTVRITAQLIDAGSDHHRWAQSYERDVSEILTVQDSLALDIAAAIRAELSPEEHEARAQPRSVNPDAYEVYLHGRNKLGKQARESIRESIQDFQRAIDLDPMYASAYSGLSDAYTLMANYGALLPRDAFPRAKAAAFKALSLDPLLAEAHASLGLVKNYYDLDWPGAEGEYKRAIALSPSYATAHLRYARFLSMAARHDEAIQEIERARGVDPLSMVIQSNAGSILYHARRYDAAILQSRKTLEIDPNRVYARIFLAMCYEQKGMYPQAIQELERSRAYFGGAPSVGLAHVYALTGRTAEARRILAALEKEGDNADWYFIAGVYAALADKASAFICLEKAYAKRDFFLASLKVDPYMDPLRSDARFQDLLRHVGPPEMGNEASMSPLDNIAGCRLRLP
jgi:TolB-like protein/DNA-binding winged helix-turn-helix (wHTH) protein